MQSISELDSSSAGDAGDDGALKLSEAELEECVETYPPPSKASDHPLSRFRRYERLSSKARLASAKSKSSCEKARRQLQQIQDDLEQLRLERDEVRQMFEREEKAEIAAGVRANRVSTTVEATEDELSKKQCEQESLAKEYAECQASKASLAEELEKAKSSLGDVRHTFKQSKQQQRKSDAIERMKSHFIGVRGKLTDLVRPADRKYNGAMMVALGR